MLKAYKYRIYPNKEQEILINKHFGCCRFIYNWALEKRIKLYEKEKKSISRFDLQAEIPKMKEVEETQWLNEVNAQSLQASLRNLDEAYTRFFRQKKGFPRFKSKHDRQSFQCPQRSKVNFETNRLDICKIPNIKIELSRKFKGLIKTVTISKTPTNKYFASILVEDFNEEPKSKNKIEEEDVIGLDLGVKDFAVLSNGEKIANPKFLKKSQKRLKRQQRKLSRKKKGSKNRDKQRKKVALLHEKVANQRRDFQHKISTKLIRENQAIALETLQVSKMQKNSRLSREISDAAWTQFVTMLEYKAKWNDKTILKIGQFEPSSKLCSCGNINNTLQLKDREWTCSSCGVIHDRDILAANNIKKMALHPKNFLGQGMSEFTSVETLALAGR